MDGTATISAPSSGCDEKGNHFIQKHLRNLVRLLPRVDKSGLPFVAKGGAVGKESGQSREYLDDKNLKKHLNAKLSSFPVHHVIDPRKRAEKHRIGMFWTTATMEKAQDEFYVPNALKVIFICPEVMDRDLLLKDPKFRTEDGGVMSPCLQCGSNKYMDHTGTTRKVAAVLKIGLPTAKLERKPLRTLRIFGCSSLSWSVTDTLSLCLKLKTAAQTSWCHLVYATVFCSRLTHSKNSRLSWRKRSNRGCLSFT